MSSKFKRTNWTYGIVIDDSNKLFKIDVGRFVLPIFNYSDLIKYELIEDNTIVTSGGLGSAVVGGIVAGGVGAIVGGLVGNKKQKAVCESLKIKLVLQAKDENIEHKYIKLITSPTKKEDKAYKQMANYAEDAVALLERIMAYNQSQSKNIESISLTDELFKLKNLLDSGVITTSEYDILKRKIIQS